MDQQTIDNALAKVNAITQGIAAANAVGILSPATTNEQKLAGALQVASALCPAIAPQAAASIALANAVYGLFKMFGIFGHPVAPATAGGVPPSIAKG